MQLEHSAYEWQLKIFETQIDILTEEEQRVRFAIDNIKQQRAGLFEMLVLCIIVCRIGLIHLMCYCSSCISYCSEFGRLQCFIDCLLEVLKFAFLGVKEVKFEI